MQPEHVTTSYATLSDGALVERSRAGDADAFAELYRRYLTPIYRFVFRRVGGDAAIAEDLTSQLFFDVLSNLDRYKERGRFPAWLFTITRRRLADYYRKAVPEALEDLPDPGPGMPDRLEQQENILRLGQLLEKLDKEKRELLQLRFSDELSFADMAAILGRSEAAVKMSLYRVLDWLRLRWEADHE